MVAGLIGQCGENAKASAGEPKESRTKPERAQILLSEDPDLIAKEKIWMKNHAWLSHAQCMVIGLSGANGLIVPRLAMEPAEWKSEADSASIQRLFWVEMIAAGTSLKWWSALWIFAQVKYTRVSI